MASVLLVEDEVLIRMMIAGMVEELDHRVAAEAGDIEAGCDLAENTDFDLALLDVIWQRVLISKARANT